ncbi:MAG: electron transfer flavoprotein subunit alpha [Candidatus Lokiarchaeota archaeon]|nr:electron transfer flavoprotein subunit alpha [Candidatus Lokiarchaeota archaeon]
MSVIIDEEQCTGCGNCVDSCPYGAIELENNKATVLPNCNLCGVCIDNCPLKAISLERDKESGEKIDLSQYKGVWVIAEHYKQIVHKVAFQLLGKGRELSNLLDSTLTFVILGANFDEKLGDFSEYGMDEIIYVKSPILKDYYSDLYVKVISELIEEHKPEIILIGATPTGRDFAPRVAKRLHAGLTADCTGLDINPETKNLLQTRPTFGGNIMATIRTPFSRPQMATVRPGVFKALKKIKKEVPVKVIDYKFTAKDTVSKIIKIINTSKSTVNLEDAKIIVAGGRGVGSKENFKLIEDLAKALGAEIGGSRITVELNWVDPDRQIGQTGKTVSPKLYIACGISGAVQHIVGMENSDVIVAINKDPNAPIFGFAHYGIVGNLNDIIPLLIEEINKLNLNKE